MSDCKPPLISSNLLPGNVSGVAMRGSGVAEFSEEIRREAGELTARIL